MRVSPSVRAVQVPDENPMHPLFTSIYLIGRSPSGQVLTIDSGEAIDRYQWMLRGYLAATEHAEIAFSAITHYHADHSGNLRWLRESLGAEVLVYDAAKPFLGDRLPESGTASLQPGQTLDLASGVRVEVIATPGHSPDSLCYYIENEGVLFTGDTILGSSTTTVHDLGQYRNSLSILAELPKLDVMCPGHGAVIADPRERLQGYIAHRDARERQVLQTLAIGGPLTSWDVMLKMYAEIDPRLRRAAAGNVEAHLRELELAGRLQVYPGIRRPDAAPTSGEIAEHERRHAIKKEAETIVEEERWADVAKQENPPDDMWQEPPRYELVGTASE